MKIFRSHVLICGGQDVLPINPGKLKIDWKKIKGSKVRQGSPGSCYWVLRPVRSRPHNDSLS